MTNFFEHFNETVLTEFHFLKDFGFADFEEEQIAYEYHLISKSSNGIEIDFHIETLSSTPIWVSINGIYLEKIFNSNLLFERYEVERENLYNTNFDKYLKSGNTKFIGKNQEVFLKKGLALNENYLKEIKALLIENKKYLEDSSIYQEILSERKRKNELESAEYYKSFKSLFDKEGQVIQDETFFKAQFENHFLTVETDKISVEINSYDEFIEFLNSFSIEEYHYESILYKFELK
jgi:hypothetical protein